MNGDGASFVLAVIGMMVAGGCAAADRPRAALAVGVLFCAPALVRLWIAAVAS